MRATRPDRRACGTIIEQVAKMSLDSTKRYLWQDQPEVWALHDRRASFGAWSVILRVRRYIIKYADRLEEEGFDRARAFMDPRLDDHGEPPTAFIRCWLLDQVDTYAWLADHAGSAPARKDAAREVAVARIMWRRAGL